MLAQVEISQLEQQKLQEIEKMRQRMVQITNEAALSVLGLKNDLARLERSYNESRVQCLRWEKILANSKDAITNSFMDKDRTLDAINNLYRILCRRRGESETLISFSRLNNHFITQMYLPGQIAQMWAANWIRLRRKWRYLAAF